MVVDKIKAILATMLKEKKDVALLALLKMDDITDRWSLVLSSSSIKDEATRRELYEYFVGLLIKELDDEDKNSIARVGVFPMANHLVTDLLQYKEGHLEDRVKANGNVIHEAYILRSKTPNKSPQLSLGDV